jgi:hypothetical protein
MGMNMSNRRCRAGMDMGYEWVGKASISFLWSFWIPIFAYTRQGMRRCLVAELSIYGWLLYLGLVTD